MKHYCDCSDFSSDDDNDMDISDVSNDVDMESSEYTSDDISDFTSEYVYYPKEQNKCEDHKREKGIID